MVSNSLLPVGVGLTIATSTPSNGCSIFGPEVPPGGLRPVDPDATGGYYQPLRADLQGADTVFDLVRIQCDLLGATSAAAAAFAEDYVPNSNPTLLPLTATVQGTAVSLDAIPAGSRVVFEASWPAQSAEEYALYDPASDTVIWKRESMALSWYSDFGSLDEESTGRSETDPATTSDDGFVAPSEPASGHLWVVLRDSRAGVDFAMVTLAVE
jgi:hypothetical protein